MESRKDLYKEEHKVRPQGWHPTAYCTWWAAPPVLGILQACTGIYELGEEVCAQWVPLQQVPPLRAYWKALALVPRGQANPEPAVAPLGGRPGVAWTLSLLLEQRQRADVLQRAPGSSPTPAALRHQDAEHGGLPAGPESRLPHEVSQWSAATVTRSMSDVNWNFNKVKT